MDCTAKRRALGMALLLCLCLAGVGSARTVEGVVFFDDNGNGVADAGEDRAAGVVVSDGGSIVLTDEAGAFRISLDDAARYVFVSAPSGARAADGWYLPVGEQTEYAFPLARVDAEGPLVFVQLSDVHYAPTPEEFKLGLRDRRMEILPDPVLDAARDDINSFAADFVIVTGDLAADSKYPEPETVDRWLAAMKDRLASDYAVPVYTAVGNHDVIRDEAIGKAVYERNFGPTYYSFNVKGTHCVVLDTQQLVGTKLVYTVDARQLAWLEQDLAAVETSAPVLVFCHEPTYDWAETPETRALVALLEETDITALLNGHWHTNVVLREEPFYELTSGAVCGAWWEGPGPDGTGFGYRVFRLARGNLESMWTTPAHAADVARPSRAVLTWADRLEAALWGRAEAATYRWDDGPTVDLDVDWNGLWSSMAANLNVAGLADGYHDLAIEFVLSDGERISALRSYYVSNPAISLEEIFEHPETYRGKIVAAPELEVRAVMGSDISAFDATKTIIVSDFPYAVARHDVIGIVGMYHPTSTAPIKTYDGVFYTIVEE